MANEREADLKVPAQATQRIRPPASAPGTGAEATPRGQGSDIRPVRPGRIVAGFLRRIVAGLPGRRTAR